MIHGTSHLPCWKQCAENPGERVPDGRALVQIKNKRCADKYRIRGEPIHLVGVAFSKDSRNFVGFEVETL